MTNIGHDSSEIVFSILDRIFPLFVSAVHVKHALFPEKVPFRTSDIHGINVI